MTERLPGWRDIPIGGVAFKPSEEYKTGDWRVFRPVLNKEKCNRCYLCHFYCPEGAIKVLDTGDIEIDYDYCKGCLICVNECPRGALESVQE
ncbi:MAG: 4Fe-4S binding protein [Candidatus Baldrarchaeia archaeon]